MGCTSRRARRGSRSRAKSAAISEIGAALRVNTVLEGSVRRSGKRLRITAQLIDVGDGYHLWSERYDRELDDVFAIQDDIAVNIAQKLRIALADKPADEPLVKPATRNLDAYELYLKARFFVEQRGEGLVKGLEFFRQAIAADPDYAVAYAGMAETLSLLAVYGAADPRRVMPGAKGAAQKAVQLDDGLAEAHNAMALVSVLHDWDWARAIAEFDRALEINPNFVPSQYWKGLFCHLFVERQRRAGAARNEARRGARSDRGAPRVRARPRLHRHRPVTKKRCSARSGCSCAIPRRRFSIASSASPGSASDSTTRRRRRWSAAPSCRCGIRGSSASSAWCTREGRVRGSAAAAGRAAGALADDVHLADVSRGDSDRPRRRSTTAVPLFRAGVRAARPAPDRRDHLAAAPAGAAKIRASFVYSNRWGSL